MEQPKGKKDDEVNPWALAGMATTIPMMMVSGPLVGYGLGWVIRHWTGGGRWVEILGLILGAVASVQEIVRIIRKIS